MARFPSLGRPGAQFAMYSHAPIMTELSILYLMEDTDLSGGVRVQLAHADELIRRGHRVSIATKGAPLTWRSSTADWIYTESFESLDASRFDFVIGTFWRTVEPAWRLAPDRAVHLCQGYEGSFTFYEDDREEIERVYELPIPKLTVGSHLEGIIERFTRDVTWIGQIVEDDFYQPKTAESSPLRVLLAGASEIDIKGIDVGYGAVLHARFNGAEVELIRVSPWRPSGSEPVEQVAEFHVALNTNEMRKLMPTIDILLAPSRREEGFGLHAAEAMASGVPVILTRIPSYLSFSPNTEFATFADENDPVALGDALINLSGDEQRRRRQAELGRRVAEQWRAREVGDRLEQFFLERVNTSRNG